MLFTATWTVDGVLTDPDVPIVMSDPTNAFGARRSDTLAVVVNNGTAMTRVSAGVYTYDLVAPPADGLTYEWWSEIVWQGVPIHLQNTLVDAAPTGVARMNLNSLTRAVQLAMRSAADSALADAPELVNDALMDFVISREWKWRRRNASLAVVEGQDYVELPEDFGQLDSLMLANGVGRAAFATVMDRINEYRQGTSVQIDNVNAFYYCLGWSPQVFADQPPRARIELWPTPSDTIENYIVLSYRFVPQKLVSSTDVPNIPAFCHPALKQWMQAYAMRQYTVDGWQDATKRAEEMADRAAMETGGQQANKGRMRGGGLAGVAGDPIVLRPDLRVEFP
jgi:hypothetical protein